MEIKISNFDVSEYLDDEETIASYLSSIIEEGDPQLLLAAISDVAKARGMAKIASDSGLGRESLYKALKPESKPRFETVLKVLNSLGVTIHFTALHDSSNGNINVNKTAKSNSVSKIKKQVSQRNTMRHVK